MMLGGAIANATAFIGGNAIYHTIDAKNASIERKRHDLVIEELNKQSAKWNQNRIKHLDFISEQRQKKLQSKSDFIDLDSAIIDYVQRNPKPELTHYYQPSSKQHEYEKTYIAGSIIGSAVLSKFM